MSMLQFDPFGEIERWLDRQWTMPASLPMDAYREGDTLVVDFDVPGVKLSDIDLTVEQNTLTVRAERRGEPLAGDEVIAAERPKGSFRRQVLLGESLDAEHVEASYDNGVLHVTVPVLATARKIAIGQGEQRAIGIGTN